VIKEFINIMRYEQILAYFFLSAFVYAQEGFALPQVNSVSLARCSVRLAEPLSVSDSSPSLHKQYALADKTFGKIEIEAEIFDPPKKFTQGLYYGDLKLRALVGGIPFRKEFAVTGRPYDESRAGFSPADFLPGRSLEIGCGPEGLVAKGLKARGLEVYGIDTIVLPGQPAYLKIASVTDIPFPDGYFANVFSDFSVFMMFGSAALQEPGEAEFVFQSVREIIRVLSKGGRFQGGFSKESLDWIAKTFPKLKLVNPSWGPPYFVKK